MILSPRMTKFAECLRGNPGVGREENRAQGKPALGDGPGRKRALLKELAGTEREPEREPDEARRKALLGVLSDLRAKGTI